MPRRYDMTKRAQAKERTRERIVEATAELHGKHGVLGTTWPQIAKEADVSVATVYAHFPSLDELLPACGALVMERVQPPRPDDAAEAIAGATELEERFRLAAARLFDFYERGGSHIEVDVRERDEIPAMREWEEFLAELSLAFAREAAAAANADPATVELAAALLDLPTFKAIRARGASVQTAVTTVARLATTLVNQEHSRKETT